MCKMNSFNFMKPAHDIDVHCTVRTQQFGTALVLCEARTTIGMGCLMLREMRRSCILIPRLLPVFQCCTLTLKNWEGLGTRLNVMYVHACVWEQFFFLLGFGWEAVGSES